jgi:hypothetical protein
MLPPFSLFPFLVVYTKQLKPPPACVPTTAAHLHCCRPSAPRRAHPSDLPLLELNLRIGSPPRPEASRLSAIPIPHPSSPEFGPPLAGATAPVGRPPPPFPTPPSPSTGSPLFPNASSPLAPRRRPRGSSDFGRSRALPAGHGSRDSSARIQVFLRA